VVNLSTAGMAFTSVLTHLLLLIVPAKAINQVVRRVGVEANGRVRSSRMNSEDLEAKRTDLFSSGESSTAARRDLLWQAVREVDDQFLQKTNCKLEEGTTYAKELVLLAEQTSYSKTGTASARECALMCAADSLDDRNHKNLACKSFTFNTTAHECKFFNFAPQALDTWNKDACCSSGPPCSLDKMREEIQSHFHAELERVMSSNKHLADQPKVAKHVEKQTVPKFEQKIAMQPNGAVPKNSEPKIEQKLTAVTKTKVEQKVAKQAEHVVPKFEQKVAGPEPKHTVPNGEQKVTTQAEHVAQKVAAPMPKHTVPNVVQKVTTQAEHAVPKFERKVDGAVPKHTVPKIEQKTATRPERAAPKAEQKVASHTEHPVPKLQQKVAGPVPKHTLPKVEQKVMTQAEHVAQKVAVSVPKHTAPKVEQKVTKQAEHAVPKFEQKAVIRPERAVPKVEQKVVSHTEHAMPKFERKAAGPVPKHTVPNVEQKVTTQAGHVMPKFEQTVAGHVVAAQTKQAPTLPAESTVKDASLKQPRGAVGMLTNLVEIHWRLLLVLFCVLILVAVFARWLQGGLVKRFGA
jgi:hypothetical protein